MNEIEWGRRLDRCRALSISGVFYAGLFFCNAFCMSHKLLGLFRCCNYFRLTIFLQLTSLCMYYVLPISFSSFLFVAGCSFLRDVLIALDTYLFLMVE